MADRTPRKRNLLADRCAVFEANQNTDSKSGSFLTNLVRGKTTIKNVVKDDSTQATVEISENSFTTIGSGSISASIRNGPIIETLDVIGEDSISDNMFEHLRPPLDVTRKRASLMSRMNVSDVSFDTVSPQVSSSNLFQNSFESIHQPVMEVLEKDGIFVSPSKRRSSLIANRAAVFEGFTSPPSGFLFSQSKPSPERVEKNSLSAPNNIDQLQSGIASITLSSREESSPRTKDTAAVEQFIEEERSQPRRRASEKKEISAVITDSAAVQTPATVAGEESILTGTPRRRASSSKRVVTSGHILDKSPVAIVNVKKIERGSEKVSKSRRHKSLERRTTSDKKNHDAAPRKTITSSRRKSLSPRNDKRCEDTESPRSREEIAPRHSIHSCSPIVKKSNQSLPRMKSAEKRRAMLKRLLQNKRKPVVA